MIKIFATSNTVTRHHSPPTTGPLDPCLKAPAHAQPSPSVTTGQHAQYQQAPTHVQRCLSTHMITHRNAQTVKTTSPLGSTITSLTQLAPKSWRMTPSLSHRQHTRASQQNQAQRAQQRPSHLNTFTSSGPATAARRDITDVTRPSESSKQLASRGRPASSTSLATWQLAPPVSVSGYATRHHTRCTKQSSLTPLYTAAGMSTI